MAELDDMLGIIDRAFAAALGETTWEPVLLRLATVLGGEAVSLEAADRTHGASLLFDGVRIDPDTVTEYVDHYHALSPRVAFARAHPRCLIAYDHLLIDEAGMDRDPFYADFMARQGARYFVSCRLDPSPGVSAVIAVQRSAATGHVQAADIARLGALRPHLARAFTLFWNRLDAGVSLDRLDRSLAGLGVTPAERALATALGAGEAVASYARRCGISPNTAYTHYKRLKDKLDCHRHGELVVRLCALGSELATPSGSNRLDRSVDRSN